MNAYTLTAKGQITLRKELLRHLGVHPGEKISIDALPGGEVRIRAVRATGKISDVFGMLKPKEGLSLSIEEMNEVIAKGMGGGTVRITADTNVLVRAIVVGHPGQSRAAQIELDRAELVAVTLPALCEVVWVLSSFYKFANAEISAALRGLIDASNVAADRAAIDEGLAMLDAGGDFADGVIADAGKWLGAETFVSFDKRAVRIFGARGEAARAPG